MLPDNTDLYELRDFKRLSKPHIEDVAGTDIYEGDKYARINGEVYSWDTLERMSEYYEEEEE